VLLLHCSVVNIFLQYYECEIDITLSCRTNIEYTHSNIGQQPQSLVLLRFVGWSYIMPRKS